MTDTRYLVHGVFWDAAPAQAPAQAWDAGGVRPVLRLQDPAGAFTDLALDAGTRLGFRLAAGGKYRLRSAPRPSGTPTRTSSARVRTGSGSTR
ncbi:hypothetical protein BJG92_02041 [Arthrobacter sp. SO5]|uniref:hypothetical protein n=1 Tax=Arthrobacter sp. SO5 TaxID=1897055 RepID=UPI001E3C80BB|nr:hypothetical protein [Arthrobacter sp. SO5]MCB5274507.1 hypothetical protein [Arthrobacter sp. SO5]